MKKICCSRYKGCIAEWDVVNECLVDMQTSYVEEPYYTYDLKPSV